MVDSYKATQARVKPSIQAEMSKYQRRVPSTSTWDPNEIFQIALSEI